MQYAIDTLSLNRTLKAGSAYAGFRDDEQKTVDGSRYFYTSLSYLKQSYLVEEAQWLVADGELVVREDGWDGSGADQVDRRPFRQKRQHFLLRRVVGQSHEPPHQPVEDSVPDLEEDEVQRHRIDEVLFGEGGRPHDVDDLRDARRVLQSEAKLRRVVLVVGVEEREMPSG